MRGENQRIRRHSGTACRGKRLRRIDSRPLEQCADFVQRSKRVVLPIKRFEREIARARNMTGSNAGTRVRDIAFEPPLSARIQYRPDARLDDRLGYNLAGAHIRLEARGARRGRAALGRMAFGKPLLNATIEDRYVVGAVKAEHEPAAGGRPQRRIIVDDNAVVPADPGLLHSLGELGGAWQHVRDGTGLVAERVDVEEPGAGDTRSLIFGAAVAPTAHHMPARVDDDEVRLAEMMSEPIGRNQRIHGRRIGFGPRRC